MQRLTLILLGALTFAFAAQADPTLMLTPSSTSGAPGSVVGWGFSVTNTSSSDWLVLTGSTFTGNPDYGSYVDYLSLASAPLYVAGPAPESATVSLAWNQGAQLGLGEFDIYATAPVNQIVSGDIQVEYDLFSQDPNSPNFDPNSFVSDGSISVPTSATVTPEPVWLPVLGLVTLLLFQFRPRAAR